MNYQGLEMAVPDCFKLDCRDISFTKRQFTSDSFCSLVQFGTGVCVCVLVCVYVQVKAGTFSVIVNKVLCFIFLVSG